MKNKMRQIENSNLETQSPYREKKNFKYTFNILRDIRDDTVSLKQNRMLLKITFGGKQSSWE